MVNEMKLCKFVFHNNEFIDSQKAKVSLFTHGLSFGTAIFEAIRIYKLQNGVNILGLQSHLERLRNSHKLMGLGNLDVESIEKAIYKFIDINNLKNAYIRIIVYPVKDCMSFDLTNIKTTYSIFGWHTNGFTEPDAISLECSKYNRPNPNMTLPFSKVCGLYVMDTIAHNESIKNGFGEALFLNSNGTVCEAAGANVFYVKNKKLYTPELLNTIKGVTREIIFDICKKLGITCIEKQIVLDDLLTADEVFLTGTFHGLKKVNSISNLEIYNSTKESIYKKIFSVYERLIKNSEDSLSKKWVTFVPYKTTNSSDCVNDIYDECSVRLATLEDKEFIGFALKSMISEIRKDGKEPDLSGWEDAFVHIINNPNEGVILVAQNKDEYIGYISVSFHTTLHTRGRLAVFEELWTAPQKRSMIVGIRLITEAENYVKNEGISRIDLGSADYDGLYKFYSGIGYHDIGPRFKKILN